MQISNGWLDDAIKIDYSHKSMERAGHKPTHLVMHSTAGGRSAQAIANYFKTSAVQASAHIIIDQQGVVIQGISMNDAAWANGFLLQQRFPFLPSPNLYTISIECVKASTDNSDSLTGPQKQSLFRVTKAICEHYDIPKRPGDAESGIISHADLDSVNRARCPGPFPWQELWDYLREDQHSQEEETVLQIDQVSEYFLEVEKDKRWRCKVPSVYDGKQYDIAFGLLDFYRTFGQVGLNGFTVFGLPTSSELRVPGTKQAVMQFCERGIMAYDPLHEVDEVPGLEGPCYPAHIDQSFGQQILSLPLIQAQSNKVVALQLELKRCLDTQNLEPGRQAIQKAFEILKPFATEKEGI